MNADLTLLLPSLALLAILTVLAVPTPVAVFFASLLYSQLATSARLAGFFRHGHELAVLFSSPGLISIPLFVLAGEIAVAAGITHRLFLLAGNLAGSVTGKERHDRTRFGASLQAVLGMGLFASVSGSGPAAVTAEGKRLAGDLTHTGLPTSQSSAFAVAVCTICLVIPPSPALTLYAAASGIATTLAFTASFVPGLLMALLLFITLRLCGIGTGEPPVDRADGRAAAGPASSARRIVFRDELAATLFALALPVLALAGFFSGFLTAPEGAAFMCAYSLVYGFSRRVLKLPLLLPILTRATVTAGGVLFMAALGALCNIMLREQHLQDQFAKLILHDYGRAGGLIVINLIPIIAGCFLETPAVVTLVAPFLFPLAEGCGLAVVQYGAVIAVASAIGLITPPYAANSFAAAETFGLGRQTALRHLLPYFVAALILLALTTLAPELSLWFPRLWGWKV